MRNLSDAAREKQYQSQRKWHAENVERLSVALKKGELGRYKRISEKRGVSMASIVKSFLEREYRKEFKTVEFKNIEVFETFLDKYLTHYDLKTCLDCLIKQHDETGASHYELAGWETKSGVSETISYSVEEKFFVGGKEVPPCDNFDYIETKIIF